MTDRATVRPAWIRAGQQGPIGCVTSTVRGPSVLDYVQHRNDRKLLIAEQMELRAVADLGRGRFEACCDGATSVGFRVSPGVWPDTPAAKRLRRNEIISPRSAPLNRRPVTRSGSTSDLRSRRGQLHCADRHSGEGVRLVGDRLRKVGVAVEVLLGLCKGMQLGPPPGVSDDPGCPRTGRLQTTA